MSRQLLVYMGYQISRQSGDLQDEHASMVSRETLDSIPGARTSRSRNLSSQQYFSASCRLTIASLRLSYSTGSFWMTSNDKERRDFLNLFSFYLDLVFLLVSPRQIFISHSYLVPQCDIKSVVCRGGLIAPRCYYVSCGSAKFPLCYCVHE